MTYNGYEYDQNRTYETLHFSPGYIAKNPVVIRIESVDDGGGAEFEPILMTNLVQGSIQLRQILCAESYFLWGGCNASQLNFECFGNRFVDNPPTGKIRLIVIPSIWSGDERVELLEIEQKTFFTGYIESAEKTAVPGYWKITAYDRLYRVRNTTIADWLQRYLAAHRKEGSHVSWYDMAGVIQSTILNLGSSNCPAEWTKDIWYPDNRDISTENGVELLRQFCMMTQRFGMLDGMGDFQWIKVPSRLEANAGSQYYCVNLYDPAQLSYDTGHVWLPKYFVSEPRTNIFYSTGETTGAEDYYNNIYTIKNSTILGDSDWIQERYECDEYGTPSSKYTADSLPPGLFNTASLCLSDAEIYHQQEYQVTALMDPTIPMGSQIFINRITDGNCVTVVESYIMERTIKFTSSQVIECTCSAKNEPYNSVVPEFEAGSDKAIAMANDISGKMAFISDGSSLTKLRAHKILSKSDYSALTEKRADTLYYVYE